MERKTPPNPNEDSGHEIDFLILARNEIDFRIKIRVSILFVYFGIALTLIGAALNAGKYEILLIIPFFGFGVALFVAQLYIAIGSISSYIANELGPFLRKNKIHAPQWENSKTFHRLTIYSVWSMFGIHLILVGLPELIALFYTRMHAFNSVFPMGPLWWFGLVFLIISFLVLLIAHIIRWCKYRSEEWKWVDRKDDN